MGISSAPRSETTLVVILGASEFPESKLGSNVAFDSSAKAFKKYLLSSEGYGLPPDNLLYLFNTSDAPGDVDRKIADFIKTRSSQLKESNQTPQDILFYYVGHGGFTDDGGSDYFLALFNTSDDHKSSSGYLIRSLAHTLKNSGRHLRRYLILDCCFSAAAYSTFQAAPLETAALQTLEKFPEKGTALLCSASKTEPSKALPNYAYTMFSTGLLKALEEGDTVGSDGLNFRELHDLITKHIRDTFPNDAVHPEVHSPDQRQGSVDQIAFFPNPAKRLDNLKMLNQGLVQKVGELSQQLSEQKERNESLSKEVEELKQQVTNQKQSIEVSPAAHDSRHKLMSPLEADVQKALKLSDDELNVLSDEIWLKLLQSYRVFKFSKILGIWGGVVFFVQSSFFLFVPDSFVTLHVIPRVGVSIIYLVCWLISFYILGWVLLPAFNVGTLFSTHDERLMVTSNEWTILETHKLIKHIISEPVVALPKKLGLNQSSYWLSFGIWGIGFIMGLMNLVILVDLSF